MQQIAWQERFYKKLSPPDENGCILFNGEILRGGYGRMCINYKKIVAHRISWIIHNGTIPKEKQVLHKCDVRRCVNIEHLFLGTNEDNIADKVKKNRQQRGERIYSAILTEDNVKEIKILLNKKIKQKLIALKFNVTHSAISHINTGLTWKYIKVD